MEKKKESKKKRKPSGRPKVSDGTECIQLPKKCPRGWKDCQPLSQIKATKEDFFCCGLNDGKRRRYAQDRFRLCCRTRGYDTVSDMDERDMTTEIYVLSGALTIALNMDLEEAGRYIPLPSDRKKKKPQFVTLEESE